MQQVRDVMTNEVRTIDPETPILKIARIMRDDDIGAVPVAEDDRLIGMVTDRDIVIRALADGEDFEELSARDVMSPRLLYCTEDQSLEAVLKNMGEQQIRRLPVVNREKRLVGVVSLGDLSGTAKPAKAGEALKEVSKPTAH